jgi:rhodanese-related sulfurtransferase
MFEEISPSAAYEALKDSEKAQLIDCRTQAEWAYVGTPDLSAIDKQLACLEWQTIDGQPNAGFTDQIAAHFETDTPIYIICRSGVRSAAACAALAQRGFTTLFNVAGGFEGDPNADGHRGTVNGWKHAGLPWRQK